MLQYVTFEFITMLPLGMGACGRRALACRFGRVGARTG